MPKLTKSNESTEADLIRARFAVRYAELQRTAKRLLEQSSTSRPRSSDNGAGEDAQLQDSRNEEEEEDEEFVVEDER